MNFILFFYLFELKLILYQGYSIPVEMIGTCQNIRLFIESQLTSFLVL